jgi:hypothetical protein
MTKEEFEAFTWDRTPIEMKALDSLARALGPISTAILRLSEVDREAGTGRISTLSRCMWLTGGRRFTVTIDDGVIGCLSRDPDPLYPGLRVAVTDKADVAN